MYLYNRKTQVVVIIYQLYNCADCAENDISHAKKKILHAELFFPPAELFFHQAELFFPPAEFFSIKRNFFSAGGIIFYRIYLISIGTKELITA